MASKVKAWTVSVEDCSLFFFRCDRTLDHCLSTTPRAYHLAVAAPGLHQTANQGRSQPAPRGRRLPGVAPGALENHAFPTRRGELTAFMQWLTHTHTMRWHTHYQTLGSGHLYQGRFKSFPVAEDGHFFAVVRYVERNALRSNLVKRAENWRWSSLWRRQHSGTQPVIPLADWPLPMPSDWLAIVNRPETEAELAALRQSVNRSAPFGNPDWQKQIARRYNIEYTLRPRGRPKKKQE